MNPEVYETVIHILRCEQCGKWFYRLVRHNTAEQQKLMETPNHFCCQQHAAQRKLMETPNHFCCQQHAAQYGAKRYGGLTLNHIVQLTCQMCGKRFGKRRGIYNSQCRERMRRGTSVTRNWYCGQDCRAAALRGRGIRPPNQNHFG